MDNNKKISNLLVAPISGGCFPHQLSILRKLATLEYEPDIVLASSGGNVSSYLASAGKWTPQGINRVVEVLDSRFFIQSWFPESLYFVPSIFVGFFTGTVYKSSDDAIKLFTSYFTPSDITDTEIWVGTINESTGSVCMFGNRSYEQSIIKGYHFNRRLFKSEPLRYLNGDLRKICKSSTASASIPLILESQEIDGERYIDGGTKFASPLTPLQDEIKNLAAENNNKLHIIYVNGYDVESDLPLSKKNSMIDYGKIMSDHIVRGFTLQDRMVGYEIIKDTSSGKLHYADVTSAAIPAVYKKISLTDSSMFEIYPTNTDILDYTQFKGSDVLSIMDETDTKCAAHLWWSGDSELFNGIDGVIISMV